MTLQEMLKIYYLNFKIKIMVQYLPLDSYITTQNVIKEYALLRKTKLEFDKIDMNFYNDFTTYLRIDKKNGVNSIGKHIKIIKTLMNEATEEGINTNTDFKKKRFMKISERVENIYLNESELEELGILDLSSEPHYERIRDLFLVGCYTGLRFSDFSVLRPDQVKDGFIETTQLKTDEEIVIPIHEKVEGILNKYKGKLPASISSQKTNEYLKEIAKKLTVLEKCVLFTYTKDGEKKTENIEKHKLVTTHKARRSFATNEYNAVLIAEPDVKAKELKLTSIQT